MLGLLKKRWLLIEFGRKGEKMNDINADDFLKLMNDIYAKVQGAENLIKDGKFWLSVNKLIGLRQKMEQVVQRVQDKNEDNSDNPG